MKSLVTFPWFSGLIVLALLMSPGPALAEDPTEQYLRIYDLITQADMLKTSGQADLAKAKYQKAQTGLWNFKNENPRWHVKVIAYRLNYLTEKIASLSQQLPATAGAHPSDIQKSASPSSGPQVKLLNAGAEPRRALRIHANPGDKQSLNMTLKMVVDMQIGNVPGQVMNMPVLKINMDTTVKNVSDNGDVAFETILGDISATDEPGTTSQIPEAQKALLGGFKGLTIKGTMSNRGFTLGTDIKMPPEADPQIRPVMEQMKDSFSTSSLSLPEEPVGPGAKWEAKQTVKSEGMTINQTETYELLSIEGDRINAKCVLAQHAANQKIQNPALPGMKLDMTKMTGSGSANFTQDLSQIIPSSATSDSHTEVTMGMNAGGQKQTMIMKKDMNIRMEAK